MTLNARYLSQSFYNDVRYTCTGIVLSSFNRYIITDARKLCACCLYRTEDMTRCYIGVAVIREYCYPCGYAYSMIFNVNYYLQKKTRYVMPGTCCVCTFYWIRLSDFCFVVPKWISVNDSKQHYIRFIFLKRNCWTDRKTVTRIMINM